jgi:HSP20 family protein
MDVRKPTEGQTPQTVGETRPSTFAGPFSSLRDDIDRMFDNFMLSPFSRRLLEMDPFRRRGLMTADVTPRMDVVETPEAIEVTAELPGVAEKDVDVSIGEGMVTIRGEKKHNHEEKKGDYQLSERSYGTFVRSFRVPDNVDEEHIVANFDKGILTLSLPKKEKTEPQRRKIDVKGPAH